MSNQVDAQDQKILEIAVELCREIRLSKRWDPRTIGWSQTVPWDDCYFSPGVRKRTHLLLPLGLRTKLEPDQWRPLLAYSFLQKKGFVALYAFLIFVITMVGFLLATAYVGFVFGSSVVGLFGSILFFPVLVLSFVALLHYSKKKLLGLVRKASEVGGRDNMLAALEKINSLGIWEVEEGKRRRGLIGSLWPIPSIVERIEFLRKLQ